MSSVHPKLDGRTLDIVHSFNDRRSFGSKLCSFDRDARKRRGKNVPLASADVRGRGRLNDDPEECLGRRLVII